MNNATSRFGRDQAECVCEAGFFGSRCEKEVFVECRNNICVNGGECRFNAEKKTIQCLCARGKFRV